MREREEGKGEWPRNHLLVSKGQGNSFILLYYIRFPISFNKMGFSEKGD